VEISFQDLPEFQVAVKRENEIRDAAFLRLTTRIGPIELKPMTPRDLLILDGLDNPVVSGGIPTSAQLADFMWKLSTEYKDGARWRRWRFAKRVAKLDFISTIQACFNYIRDTFQDAPAGSGEHSLPYAGWCAHLAVSLAPQNPAANLDLILNTPLKILFQLRRVMRRVDNPNAPMINFSDRIKREEALKLYNHRRKLIQVLKKRSEN